MFFSLLVIRKCETVFLFGFFYALRFCSSWPHTPFTCWLLSAFTRLAGLKLDVVGLEGPSVLTGPRCCCSGSPNPTEYNRTHRRTPVETCLGGVLETFSSNFGAPLLGGLTPSPPPSRHNGRKVLFTRPSGPVGRPVPSFPPPARPPLSLAAVSFSWDDSGFRYFCPRIVVAADAAEPRHAEAPPPRRGTTFLRAPLKVAENSVNLPAGRLRPPPIPSSQRALIRWR